MDIFFAISRDRFLPCAAFLKVCPFLHTRTLSSRCLLSPYERKIKKHHPHLSLRVVELVGFELHTGNVEFLIDLFESATQLEKVVIDYIDVERIEEEFYMETKCSNSLNGFSLLVKEMRLHIKHFISSR